MNDENVKPNVVAKPFRDHKSLLKLLLDFFLIVRVVKFYSAADLLHVKFVALRNILKDDELVYNYEGDNLPWRKKYFKLPHFFYAQDRLSIAIFLRSQTGETHDEK